jgi:hypothetical protein
MLSDSYRRHPHVKRLIQNENIDFAGLAEGPKFDLKSLARVPRTRTKVRVTRHPEKNFRVAKQRWKFDPRPGHQVITRGYGFGP